MAARPSPEMAALLDRMAAEDGDLPDATTLAPEVGRSQTAQVHQRWRIALPIVGGVADFVSPGAGGQPMRCRRIDPMTVSGPGTILFIHGGGWAFCDIDTHEDGMRRLANAAGMPVFACDYRLAPENRFPDGLNDCIVFWQRLVAGKIDGASPNGPFYIAGDSAGANLALAMILAELQDGRTAPDGALLLYGAYGCDFETPSYREHADGPGLTRDKMRRFWDWYCPAGQRADFRAAPLMATDDMLRSLPRLLIVAAEVDPLLSDSAKLAERLVGLGRRDAFRVLPGLVHGFFQMGAWLPAAAEAVNEMGCVLQEMRR